MHSSQLPEEVSARELTQLYLDATRSSLSQIRDALAVLSERPSVLDLALIHRLSHNIKGSSYQFGFTIPGTVADGMERLVVSALRSGGNLVREDHEVLSSAWECLRESMECLQAASPLPDPGPVCRRMEDRCHE